jgi:iron complex outermembrane receptor protein
MKPNLRMAAILLAAVCVQAAAHAQEAEARLVGVVRDATGAAVPGARVDLDADGAGHVATRWTDRAGRFAIDAPAGRYRLAVRASGLASAVEDVVLAAHADTAADFTLEVAPRSASIEVTARAGDRPLVIETDPRVPRQPLPAHDGADYLKTIPGFSVIRKGGADGDPVLRGMAGSRIGILLDGEGVLGGCGSRMDPPTAYAYPEAYDRITVVKGPQTVVHGPGHSAGVVRFEHDRPTPGVRAYLAPTVGSAGRNDQVADLRATGERLYARAAGTRSATDDYEDGAGAAVHSRYERWSLSGAAGWTPDAATRVEFSASLSDGEAAYADRMMDGVRFDRTSLGLRVERRELAPWLQALEAQAWYSDVDHVMDNYSLRPFLASMMMPNPTVSNPDRRTFGARVQGSLRVGSSTEIRLGGDWQGNRHSVRGSANQLADPYEARPRTQDATFDSAGFFAELVRPAGAAGRLVAGARLDWWSGRDERERVALGSMGATVANPTAGRERGATLPSGFARYERVVGRGTTVYAGLGHARRAPDYWELVGKESADSASSFLTRPEKTTQLDAGLLFERGPVSGSLALFAGRNHDFVLIEAGFPKAAATMGGMPGAMPATTRAATITRNVDASSWGAEASLGWAIAPSLNADASLAWVRGENRTDERPLAQLPPLEARLGLRYARGRASLGALARLVAAQERYAIGQGNIVGQDLGPTPAFAVLSANAGLTLAKRARLAAGVDNLLDARYAEFVSRSGAMVAGYLRTTRINEPGRTLWARLEWTYY